MKKKKKGISHDGSLLSANLLSVILNNRKKKMKKKGFSHDWSLLSADLLSVILNKLADIHDCVRFSAVCTSWRTVFLQGISSNKFAPLLLVAPPAVADLQQRALYSPSTEKVYGFRLQVPRRKVCCGSSFGWLVTLEKKTHYDWQIQLQNPFLNRIINLPPPDNIIQQHHGVWDGNYIRKAVLSSDPCSLPDDFVVMAIMSMDAGLAFFKPGNTTWTSIGDEWCTNSIRGKSVVDVIFSHKTNRFYALHCNTTLTATNLLGDEGGPKLTHLAPQRPSQFCGFAKYLVEDLSSGDLFLVCKKSVNKDMDSLWWYFDKSSDIIVQFNVFRLDICKGIWIWTRIDNLGENIMFLGRNGSILRSVRDCPGCEPNSIYYTDDYDNTFHRRNFQSYGPPFDGLYNLKDGTIRPHYSYARSTDPFYSFERLQPPLFPPEALPQAIWIEPTLKRCN